jgi:hypothetical protein
MSAQPAGLTYSEIIDWAGILGTFTASSLAYEMGVDVETGRRAVGALCTQGICRDTGDMLDGPHGYEHVIEYIPLPPGPTRRERSGPSPEQIAVSEVGRISVERGLPVRTRKRNRSDTSIPGRAQGIKDNERNYQRQMQARREREKQKAQAQKRKK